jgi:hypothetical protein
VRLLAVLPDGGSPVSLNPRQRQYEERVAFAAERREARRPVAGLRRTDSLKSRGAVPYPVATRTETCWFASVPNACPCDGPLVRCHLIPKHVLRQNFPKGFEGRALAVLQADPRSWVWGCGGSMGLGGHHGQLDTSRKLRIPRELLPDVTEEFAAELGLTPWLDREYGVPESDQEAAA